MSIEGTNEGDTSEEEKKAEEKAQKELEIAKLKQEQEKEKLTYSFSGFLGSLKAYLKSLTSLREGIDHEGTAKGIKQDVEFRGHAAWILVCSIFIACLGLNTNSAAVVIGAMLISPLMGPIIGVGFAAGTNNGELLIKSLKNYGTTILISLVISTFYFLVSPLKDINEELVSRTSATIYAIVVAFVGGAAGIIAGSRPLKSNVVPGVAIATALMPPICTAGYGLALGNISYFLGAFYLFFINSVFIALPTYLYIKYLRFPVTQFVDPKRERRIKNYIFIFLLVVMVPSVITFYNVLQKTIVERNISNYMSFVSDEAAKNGAFMLSPTHYNDGDSVSCSFYLKGTTLSDELVSSLRNAATLHDLNPASINIVQDADIISIVEKVNAQERTVLSEREQFIQALEIENQDLKTIIRTNQERTSEFRKIESELSALFPKMNHKFLLEDSSRVNFIYTWQDELAEEIVLEKDSSLRNWLPKRLNVEAVKFIRFDE